MLLNLNAVLILNFRVVDIDSVAD